MKLLYIHQYFKFPAESGGTRSYDLATSFVGRGYEVEVITGTSDEDYSKKERWSVIQKDGITVHYIYLPYDNKFSYLRRSVIFFQFLWFSTFRLLKLKGDVVLATSTPLTIGIPALVKKWFQKTPFIFEVRDVWPEAVIAIGAIKNRWVNKLLFRLERMIYKNASYIVPLSNDMKESIVTRYPKYSEKASLVIENISEISRFQNDRSGIDLKHICGFKPRFSVLYAGTFGKVNGIYKMVELAERTRSLDPGIVYILLGAGAEKETVSEQARKKGLLGKNLFVLEPVSKDELPIWYNSVSMGSSFVIDIPALWANSANKFFDTLAAGKPILINHEGWQADTIRQENIGFVLPFEITDEVAKEFVSYSHDTELQETQRENALIVAKARYSLEVAVSKYMTIFSKFTGRV